MLNQMVLVGRITENPELVKDDERDFCNITIAVQRSFKNENGEYPVDIIPITLWNGIALNTAEYCHKGDLVGVKGRIENQDGKIVIIAEKITFLANKKENE